MATPGERGGQGIAESYFNACCHPHELRPIRHEPSSIWPNWASPWRARPCCRPGPPSRSMPCSPPAASDEGGRLSAYRVGGMPGKSGGGRHHGADPGRAFHLRLVTRAQQGGQLLAGTAALELLAERLEPLHFLTLFTASRRHRRAKRMTGLWRSCPTALLLWCAWPALAAELPPAPWRMPAGKEAVILDTRPSYFYQGWPMDGRSRGPCGRCRAALRRGKYSDEEWPVALASRAEGRQTRRPLWHPREVAVRRASRAQAELSELQGMERCAPGASGTLAAAGPSALAGRLAAGKPVIAAPGGGVEGVRGGL